MFQVDFMLIGHSVERSKSKFKAISLGWVECREALLKSNFYSIEWKQAHDSLKRHFVSVKCNPSSKIVLNWLSQLTVLSKWKIIASFFPSY